MSSQKSCLAAKHAIDIGYVEVGFESIDYLVECEEYWKSFPLGEKRMRASSASHRMEIS